MVFIILFDNGENPTVLNDEIAMLYGIPLIIFFIVNGFVIDENAIILMLSNV